MLIFDLDNMKSANVDESSLNTSSIYKRLNQDNFYQPDQKEKSKVLMGGMILSQSDFDPNKSVNLNKRNNYKDNSN